MKRYQTSIKKLLQAKLEYENLNNVKTIFLSDWDSDFDTIKIPHLNYNNIRIQEMQKYFFWTDEWDFKANIQQYFSYRFNNQLPLDEFTIGMNGTSCLMLSLVALKEIGIKKTLILTPIYFSILNLLDELEYDVYEYNLSIHNDFFINIKEIEQVIIDNKIEMIIITNPIFGSGVEVPINTIKKLALLCNKYNIWLVMDYVYGGLPWTISKREYYVFNYPTYLAIKEAKKHVFIESISKRIFLNGVKLALIFSTPNLMRRILRLSIFMVGSMSAQQMYLVPQIYSELAEIEIVKQIHENACTARNNYNIIKTFLSDKDWHLSNSLYGYFSILSIPKAKHKDDIEIAIDLLNNTGVLTTPHSRYLLSDNHYYSFRINLLLKKTTLIEGLSRIKNLI